MEDWSLQRYRGEPLEPGAKIGVIANDALGNFVVATPLLQMLRSRHEGSSITFFGGIRTRELQEASDLIDVSVCLHGHSHKTTMLMLRDHCDGFDLVVNLENGPLAKVAAATMTKQYAVGPCAGVGGRGDLPCSDDDQGRLQADEDWLSEEIAAKHRMLQSGWIGEIFCRMAYLSGAVPSYRVPVANPGKLMPILISTAGSGSDKLWSKQKWAEALGLLCRRGFDVGLLGAAPQAQREYWSGESVEDQLVQTGLVKDLRGQLTLPEVAGALAQAKVVLTIDNGILHLAAAVNAPTVGLFRPHIARLWAPPVSTLRVLQPPCGGTVSDITVASVMEAIDEVL